MANELYLAGAGAGKTQKIISESIEHIKNGRKVLAITYTTNNQAELRARFYECNGGHSEKFTVKGWYTFLLEDMIRPYQKILFDRRIEAFNFNESDPHKKGNFTIPGRAEFLSEDCYNPMYFLTSCQRKAHTGLLAKLAVRIGEKSGNAAAQRLIDIYDQIYFDEVQDLVGWDFDVVKSISDMGKKSICCVGDFRQTIYDTSFGSKQPQTPTQKIDFFCRKMKFSKQVLNTNHRCIQVICDLADSVHDGLYEKTTSLVRSIPVKHEHLIGVHFIKESDVSDYIELYEPKVLRHSIGSGKKILKNEIEAINFGASKGLGFDRVLMIPTAKQLEFLTGKLNAFASDKTDEARNKLYVAITRARYSLGIVVSDKLVLSPNHVFWSKSGR